MTFTHDSEVFICVFSFESNIDTAVQQNVQTCHYQPATGFACVVVIDVCFLHVVLKHVKC